MLGKTSATPGNPIKDKARAAQKILKKQTTTKILDNNEPLWNMLDETDTLDASDLDAELDQLMASIFTPTTNRTSTAPTHKMIIEIEGKTSGEAPRTESNKSSDTDVAPPTTRQATAREVLSCFGKQPRPSHTPCNDETLRPILEKAGILHALEMSGYFSKRMSKNEGRWQDSVVESLVEKERQEQLDKLRPGKLQLIKLMLEIAEPQRKLNDGGLSTWICTSWNLDRVDTSKLEALQDTLCGQKMPLGRLIQTYNRNTMNKSTNQSQAKNEPNLSKAPTSSNPKAQKNAKRNEKRRKPKITHTTPCERPIHSSRHPTQEFRSPNRPPQPDIHMDLEEASALLDEQYDLENCSLQDLLEYSHIKRMANEMMTRKKRQHTAVTRIQTYEPINQSGRPLLPPPAKQETHHAHITLHIDPIPHSNPNHLTQSQYHVFKCFSSPPQSALCTHNKPNTQSLHKIVFTPPQILNAARMTPRGRENGPRRTTNGYPTIAASALNLKRKIPRSYLMEKIIETCIDVAYCLYSFDVG
jgi:hypothetical protein